MFPWVGPLICFVCGFPTAFRVSQWNSLFPGKGGKKFVLFAAQGGVQTSRPFGSSTGIEGRYYRWFSEFTQIRKRVLLRLAVTIHACEQSKYNIPLYPARLHRELLTPSPPWVQ